MGTNYYFRPPLCPTCKRETDEALHIGKSSSGWCFSLHVIPEMGINDLPDWQVLLERRPAWRVFDEYDREISRREMIEVITNRGREGAEPQRDSAYFSYASNHAEPGPRGLVRHKVGPYCLGHGAGTWDLIPGYFS